MGKQLEKFIKDTSKWREMMFVPVLHLSYFLANYVFSVFITFLTDIWQLKLHQAVLITNFQEGITGIITLLVASISDAHLGKSKTLLISALSYSCGLLTLNSTFPRITEEEATACQVWGECKEKPLGGLFFIALGLISIGQCGYTYYTTIEENDNEEKKSEEGNNQQEEKDAQEHDERKFEEGYNQQEEMDDLQKASHNDDNQYPKGRRRYRFFKQLLKLCLQALKRRWIEIVGLIIALFVLPRISTNNRSQLSLFGYALLAGAFFFMVGKYPFVKPSGSWPLLSVFRVIIVAFRRRNSHVREGYVYFEIENRATSVDDLGGHDSPGDHNSRNQDSEHCELGFLGRAALYNPSTEKATIEWEKGTLCKVDQVKDAKLFIRAIYLSSVFLTYGIFTTVGSTFFVEQASNMDTHIFKPSINVPIEVLIMSSSFIKKLASISCKWIMKRMEAPTSPDRFHGAIRVGVGKALSIPCFLTASLVEAKRLEAVESERSMSAFELIPQLCLLGAMDGVAVSGIEGFFDNALPESLSKAYGASLAEGVTGAGKLLSLVLFHLVFRVSKTDSYPGWLGDDVNASRLDYYYKLIAAIGLVTCFTHPWIIWKVTKRQRESSIKCQSTSDLA